MNLTNTLSEALGVTENDLRKQNEKVSKSRVRWKATVQSILYLGVWQTITERLFPTVNQYTQTSKI